MPHQAVQEDRKMRVQKVKTTILWTFAQRQSAEISTTQLRCHRDRGQPFNCQRCAACASEGTVAEKCSVGGMLAAGATCHARLTGIHDDRRPAFGFSGLQRGSIS